MKKLVFLITLSSCTMFFACSSDQAAKEKQDSIEAAAQADSMLQAEINAMDTTAKDSVKVDSIKH